MHVWGVLALLTGLLLSISPDAIVTAWQWETWWFRSGTIAALAIGSTFVKGT
jgi:hypothetical protein